MYRGRRLRFPLLWRAAGAAAARFEEEWVFYLGSFPKILAPSLRAGWIVVPAGLTAQLSPLKHAVDLDTPSCSHRMIAAYMPRSS